MIYVSSSCIKQNRIADVIQTLVSHGIRNIELSGGTDYYDGIERDLTKLQTQYQLQYACHAYFPPPRTPFVVNLASCNDQIYRQSIEHYESCIELLRHLDCHVLSIHAGFLIEIGAGEIGGRLNCATVYDEGKAYERFCSAYKHLEGLCSKNNINLFLENNVLSAENYRQFENCNYLMMTDHDSIMKMRRQMPFHLLLDLAHLHVSAHTLGLNYAEECKKLKEDIRWIHISENDGIIDQHKPLAPNSPITEALQALYSPDINITLETTGSVTDICSSMELINKTINM